jgi:hypothetical protein
MSEPDSAAEFGDQVARTLAAGVLEAYRAGEKSFEDALLLLARCPLAQDPSRRLTLLGDTIDRLRAIDPKYRGGPSPQYPAWVRAYAVKLALALRQVTSRSIPARSSTRSHDSVFLRTIQLLALLGLTGSPNLLKERTLYNWYCAERRPPKPRRRNRQRK